MTPFTSLTTLCALLVGGVNATAFAQESAIASRRDILYENARKHFDKAFFYKPAPGDDVLPNELAPLIIQQADFEAIDDRRYATFGRLTLEAPDRVGIDLNQPTVYVDERPITLWNRTWTERVFAMYFRPSNGHIDSGQMISVHTVLDTDGFPTITLAWDTWFQERRQRCGYTVFVSENLEREAQDRFGPPLPGRQYSIERERRSDCDPVVAAIFPRGPLPMGPYLYLDARGNVSTILCRCSPAQFEDVVETRSYSLEPIERAWSMREALQGPPGEELPVPPTAEQSAYLIERAIRRLGEALNDDPPNESR